MPPVSVVLAAHPNSYVAGLVAFRQEDGVEAWVAPFAAACAQAAAASEGLAEAVRDLVDQWLERAGRPRVDGAPARIIRLLPAQPILTAATARIALGTSYQAARVALLALEQAGILRQISDGTYDRTYAADELFTLIRRYEERVAGRAVGTESPE